MSQLIDNAMAMVNLHLGVVAGGDHDPGRGAPLPDGEGDVGSGHRAGEHQHPHLYYILYCTVLYVLVIQKRSIRRFVITEKAPTRAFSWLKAATTAFTFKTLC